MGTKEGKADKLNMLREKVKFEKNQQQRNKEKYETAKGFLKRAEEVDKESE